MPDVPGEVLRVAADMLDLEPEMVKALAVSGMAGAFVRAVMFPEPEWRKRIAHGIGGALCALFVGGLVGHMIDSVFGVGPPAYLAAGFFLGEGGLAAVYAVRDRMLGGKGK